MVRARALYGSKEGGMIDVLVRAAIAKGLSCRFVREERARSLIVLGRKLRLDWIIGFSFSPLQ